MELNVHQAILDTSKHMSNAILGKIRKIIQEELKSAVMPMLRDSNERIIEQTVVRMIADPKVEPKALLRETEDRLRAFPDLVMRQKSPEFYYPSGHSQSVVLGLRHGRLPESEVEETIERVAAERRARDNAEVDAISRAWEQVKNDDGAEYVRRYYFEGESRDKIAETAHCDATTIWRRTQPVVKRIAVILYGSAAV